LSKRRRRGLKERFKQSDKLGWRFFGPSRQCDATSFYICGYKNFITAMKTLRNSKSRATHGIEGRAHLKGVVDPRRPVEFEPDRHDGKRSGLSVPEQIGMRQTG